MAFDNQQENPMNEMMQEIEKSMAVIHSGDIVKGTVIKVKDNEVLVNIGYMADGIITRDELSYDENVSPLQTIKEGDEIEVYIVKVNDGEGNVLLSKKRVESLKVWDELGEICNSGKTVKIKVGNIVKGGAVTQIKGVRAFIPASQISATYVADLNEFVGKELEVKIIEFDKEKKKVILSRKEIEKAILEEKKQEAWSKIEKGEKRKGTVVRLTKFGAFVDLGGVDGLIHISELSWKRISDPSEVVAVGDEVEVYILDIDKEKGRISLGLKQVMGNPWDNVSFKYAEGSIVEGTVVRLADFGAFVELEPGVDALVHISQISENRINKPSDALSVGDKIKAKVMEVKAEEKKISLSIKATIEKPAQEAGETTEDLTQYEDKAEAVTMGDMVKEKLSSNDEQ